MSLDGLKVAKQPLQRCRLAQRRQNIGNVVPTSGQRWANLHYCPGNGQMERIQLRDISQSLSDITPLLQSNETRYQVHTPKPSPPPLPQTHTNTPPPLPNSILARWVQDKMASTCIRHCQNNFRQSKLYFNSDIRFISRSPINTWPAFFHKIASYRTEDNPFSEPIMV